MNTEETPITEVTRPPFFAKSEDGEIFYNPRQVYAKAEDAECLEMCLDLCGVPTEENGNGLSLWGRVQLYAELKSKP